MNKKIVSNKIAMIIAYSNFRDEEFFVTKEAIENHGITVSVISDQMGIARGIDGADVNVETTLDNLNVDKFDAIVFIGGPGALEHLDNQDSYRIAQDAVKYNKILAAICIAPVILAKSKALGGKKATVWSSRLDQSAIEILKKHDARYLKQDIVIDSRIITANGPKAARQFGEEIADAL